jgi:hypothetical protein
MGLTSRAGVLLLLASSLAAAAAARRACEESGMCSVGVSKPWVGDIKDSAALHSMLQAVPFKKELIVSIFQVQPDAPFIWLDQVRVVRVCMATRTACTLWPRQRVRKPALLVLGTIR